MFDLDIIILPKNRLLGDFLKRKNLSVSLGASFKSIFLLFFLLFKKHYSACCANQKT